MASAVTGYIPPPKAETPPKCFAWTNEPKHHFVSFRRELRQFDGSRPNDEERLGWISLLKKRRCRAAFTHSGRRRHVVTRLHCQ
jgi:hypothetical protein